MEPFGRLRHSGLSLATGSKNLGQPSLPRAFISGNSSLARYLLLLVSGKCHSLSRNFSLAAPSRGTDFFPNSSKTSLMNSPDKSKETQDNDFPGYPHYPAAEDITNQKSGFKEVEDARITGEEDVERPVAQAGNPVLVEGETEEKPSAVPEAPVDGDMEADVSEDEKMLLDDAERGIDRSDDEMAPLRAHLDETDADGDPLNEAAGREGFIGDDLVVPGSSADDAAENIGAEDEENNYYSLDDNNDRRPEGNEQAV